MKCLETRTRADGIVRRRYETKEGIKLTTYELPEPVLRFLGGRLHEILRSARNHLARELRDKQVEKLMDQGMKNIVIASELGIPEGSVSRIKLKIKRARQGATASGVRLSNNQRMLLEDIAQCERIVVEGSPMPFYVGHMAQEIRLGFDSPSDERRWLDNMLDRGLITMKNGGFLHTTKLGMEAISKGKPAKRRDFYEESVARQFAEEVKK